MPILLETPYTAWEFTDEEYPVAVVLTDLQYKHIQTELAAVAASRVIMAVPTDGGIEVYLREQEFMRGKMEQLTALLNTSDDTKHQLMKKLHEATQRQAADLPKPAAP